MQKVRFIAAHLKAIALLAAGQDVRYYLNGVCVEATPFETRLVATDGHKLGLLRHAVENEIDKDLSFIIPASTIASMKLGKRDLTLLVECEIEAGKYALHLPNTRIDFVPVDGTFPAYRRVIPKTLSGEAGNYMPSLLMAFQKCGSILLGTTNPVAPRIEQNGGASAARLTFDGYDNFVGVCMPFAFDKSPKAPKPADVSWAV